MLETINQTVQKIANSSNKQIIMGVYRNMIAHHNAFCGCNYCKILADYVQMKKYFSAYNRRMNQYDYDYMDIEDAKYDINARIEIRRKIFDLKQQKNSLKVI